MTNFNATIKDPYGKDYTLNNQPLTLGQICVVVLSSSVQKDLNEDYNTKLGRGHLAHRIGKAEGSNTPMEITTEEHKQLEDRISSVLSNAALVSSAVSLLK